MSKWPLVKIEWYDAVDGNTGWNTLEEMQSLDLPLVIDVGWKIYEDKKKIILMSSYSEDQDEIFGGRSVAIPKSWINNITKLA